MHQIGAQTKHSNRFINNNSSTCVVRLYLRWWVRESLYIMYVTRSTQNAAFVHERLPSVFHWCAQTCTEHPDIHFPIYTMCDLRLYAYVSVYVWLCMCGFPFSSWFSVNRVLGSCQLTLSTPRGQTQNYRKATHRVSVNRAFIFRFSANCERTEKWTMRTLPFLTKKGF